MMCMSIRLIFALLFSTLPEENITCTVAYTVSYLVCVTKLVNIIQQHSNSFISPENEQLVWSGVRQPTTRELISV